MCGVYDKAKHICHICGERTMHLTGWESEEPDRLDIQCIPCFGPLNVSGHTRVTMDGEFMTVAMTK